ncbi:hypothetical protein ACFQ3R_12620 [Mesonia ostreae]|uniref:DUF748 domain-containing protein n=1 Tax=Mesonia ostreae TaxID=861110 RepID=A0ABU2KFF2_9FLAO|nr:hypothetical protein [Mesonia ostreae]MDT0293428.1 hypothetical protein [Mesonia ostreae]
MKTFLKVLSIMAVLLIGGYIFTYFFVKDKIESFLEEPVLYGVATYEDLDLSLFRGSVNLTKLTWKSNKNESRFEVAYLSVKDVSYKALLFDDHIQIHSISLSEPHVFLHKVTDSTQYSSEKNGKNFDKKIILKHLRLEKGSFVFKKDSIEKVKLKSFELDIEDMLSSKDKRTEQIPFTYGDYTLKSREVFFDMNDLQELRVKELHLFKDKISLTDLYMSPKYSKKDYIKHISYEKDWMDLKIEELTVNKYELDLEEKNKFYSPLIEIKNMNFDVFRDKTVKDDITKKEMYSEMLRNLDFGVKIDSMRIRSSRLTYEEQIKKPGSAAAIFFDELNAEISDVSNLDLKREDFPTTKVKIKTQFMGKSSLNFNWNFKINDTLDRFRVNGSAYRIPDTSINSFFTPAFNVEAEGGIEQIYYNFSGDKNVASGDLKLNYEKLKFHILKKDRQRKNKILSFIANMMVKNSSERGGVSQNVGQVKRDKTKSFWNYFWSCLQSGLKKIFI